jgi:diguanylate cyclase (GGDEF)-like protein/PAS domain S-box-containing protein
LRTLAPDRAIDIDLTSIDDQPGMRQLLALSFEHAPRGIALVAPSGRWLRINQAACRIIGYSEAELLAGRCHQITHRLDAKAEAAHFKKLVSRQIHDYELDKRFFRSDGTQIWVRIHASAATDDVGDVAFVILHIEDITRRREAEADLVHAATHDELTQATNRTLLLDRLGQALATSRRSGALVGVLFCDLDGFKALNDRLGHLVGDEVLRAVAARIRLAIRPGDTLARVGGDEFVVLAPNLRTPGQIERIAARVRKAVGAPLPIPDAAIPEPGIAVSVSVGCAVGGGLAPDPEALLAEADEAMYRTKCRRAIRDSDVHQGP